MRMNKKTLLMRTASIAIFVSTIAFTSACGTTVGTNAPVASETPTATASAAPTATPTRASTIDPALGAPSPTGEKVTSAKGDYLQSVMSPEDPAMKLNPAVLDATAKTANQADVLAAQKFVVSFMAEEGIDSELNGGNITPEAWFAKNENKLSPAYKEEFRQSLNEGKPFVLNEKWQKEKYGDKYRYETSPDQPRIYDRKITPTKVWVLDNGSIAVEADISYKMPVVPKVGETGTGVQTTVGTLTYSVSKDPATGKLLIDGYQNDVTTTEG